MTLSSVFLILKNLRRKRLAVRLTVAQALGIARKNAARDAITAACAATVSAAALG